MLAIYKEIQVTIESLIAEGKELRSGEFKTNFVVGTSSFSFPMTNNQALYAISIYNQRLEGAKFLENEVLIEECRELLYDFKRTYDVHENLKNLSKELDSYEALLKEAKALLTDEDKVALFKEKFDNTKL